MWTSHTTTTAVLEDLQLEAQYNVHKVQILNNVDAADDSLRRILKGNIAHSNTIYESPCPSSFSPQGCKALMTAIPPAASAVSPRRLPHWIDCASSPNLCPTNNAAKSYASIEPKRGEEHAAAIGKSP